jgi:cytochrome c oxidase subunit 2
MQRLGGRGAQLVIGAGLAAGLAVITEPLTAAAGPLTPASPQAGLASDLFWITLGVALIVLVAVEFLIVYTSIRFRKRPGLVMPEPAQIHGNTRLEIMWSVLPALLLISLGIISVRAMGQLGAIPANARTIQVVGRQFSWEFGYPEQNVRSTNDLRVPINEPVVLEITSQDVIHSFWVPELAGKIDANPGLTTRLSFTAEQPGVYRGVCAELCGVGHATMLFTVTAMEAGEFTAWLEAGGQAAAESAAQLAAGPSPELGQRLLIEKGCGACHTVAGVPAATGAVGPPLTNVGTAAATRKPGTSAEDYLNESIAQPSAFVVPGFPPVMPMIDMSDQERAAIVAYLLTLR